MNKMEDALLLRNYIETGSDQAFDRLVARHFDLVYCSALRLVGGDAHLAQDVSQQVFTDLVRKARRLPPGVFLSGWLYKHACFTAANAVRTNRRRENRERQAAEMNNNSPDSEAVWLRLAPVLDEAMLHLKTAERDAIVLRFFDRQPFQAVGQALGTTEDAARKRVERALEKMRAFFSARGLTVSTMVLEGAMEAHSAGAAPAGVSALVASAALAGAAKSGGAGLVWIKLMSITKLQYATGALVAGLAVAIIIQSHTAGALKEENRILLEQQASQLEALKAENERLRNAPAGAAPQPPQNQARELARLRAETARLSDELATAQKAAATRPGGAIAGSGSATEVANISYNFTMATDQLLDLYVKLAGEKVLTPMTIPTYALAHVITTKPLPRSAALILLQDALKDQSHLEFSRASDGTLVAASFDTKQGDGRMRTWLPDGSTEPPLDASAAPNALSTSSGPSRGRRGTQARPDPASAPALTIEQQ